jgi:hypothetical protein
MEVNMSACSTLRATIILSGALFLSGILLLLIAEATGVAIPTAHLALLAVLTGAATLAAAVVLALLPGARFDLHNCEH